MINGFGVSRGIAIGEAYVFVRTSSEITEYNVPSQNIEKEINRLNHAVTEAGLQLDAIKKEIAKDTPDDILSFIDSHLLMTDDPAFREGTSAVIKEFSCNAEWALHIQCERLVKVFDDMEDPYLKTRKDDVIHVAQRIQRCLSGKPDSYAEPVQLKGRIVIADDLTPADTLMMQHQKVAAFITEYGGPLSHTAILARNLGIPAIVGVQNARQLIHPNDLLIIDGRAGMIINEPDDRSLKYYKKLHREDNRRKKLLNKLANKPAVTKDGKDIKLYGNINRPEDVRLLKQYADTGVGLYRTEMLFIKHNEFVDEDTQFKTYKRALYRLKGQPLTIRTLDLGADKELERTIQHGPMAHNPAMGLRAIRRCLKDPEEFLIQLRAILRVAAYGNVQMMIPMLTSISELHQVRQLLEQAKQQLRERRVKYDENLKIGAMIEVPAAALSAHAFADNMDFLSIGTNDLIQYTLAIDRVDDEVSYLYNPLHPAVLDLIRRIIDAGKKAGIPVSMCGEMASNPEYTRLLLGMGLDYFSVQANALLEVKDIIIKSNVASLRKRVLKILNCYDENEIEQRIHKMND